MILCTAATLLALYATGGPAAADDFTTTCEKAHRIPACTRLLRRYPKAAALYGYRAVAYLGKGQRDKAVADLNRMVRLGPKDARFYATRAEAYALAGRA
jgi:predicted Zn-dependent protease